MINNLEFQETMSGQKEQLDEIYESYSSMIDNIQLFEHFGSLPEDVAYHLAQAIVGMQAMTSIP